MQQEQYDNDKNKKTFLMVFLALGFLIINILGY